MGDPALWALLVLVGAMAQMVDGAVGMGFGVLSGTLIMSVGVPPALAVGIVNLAKVGSAATSGLSHWRFGNVRREWVLPLAISGGFGSILGALLLSHLSPRGARLWVPFILLGLGLLILRRFWWGKTNLPPVAGGSHPASAPSRRWWLRMLPTPPPLSLGHRLVGIGSLGGLLNGLSGAYGPVATPLVALAGKGHPRYAVGTVNLVEFFVAAAGATTLILRLGSSGFRWEYFLLLMLGSALTAPLAASLSRRLPARALGLAMGLVLMSLNVWAILRVILA